MATKLQVFLVLLVLLVGGGQSRVSESCDSKMSYGYSHCRRITEEDIEMALKDAVQESVEFTKLEQRLVASGRIVTRRRKVTDSSTNRAPKTDPILKRQENAQRPFDLATRILQERFQLSSEELNNDLPRMELNGEYGRILTSECLAKVPVPYCDPQSQYRDADAACNNLLNPTWGAAFYCFQRLMPPVYVGHSEFRQSARGGPLPDPRLLSLNVHADVNRPDKEISHMFMFYGQLIVHDVIMTALSTTLGNNAIRCCPPRNETHPQCRPITLPRDDPFYSKFGVKCMSFVRTALCSTCRLGPKVQINQVSSFVDASFVYGNSFNETDGLRTNDGTGMLKAMYTPVGELLPQNEDPTNDACSVPDKKLICFESGDARGNQHAILTAFHTLFQREHNRLAKELRIINPHWDDDTLFEEARKIVGAQMQVITYDEFLPIALGTKQMSRFQLWLSEGGSTLYDPSINPTLNTEFGTGAFRVGHTFINSIVARSVDGGGFQRLRDLFLKPFQLYVKGGLETLLSGMSEFPSQRRDRFMMPDVTTDMYRARGNNTGLDLSSLNIRRGRDNGIQPYTALVKYCSEGEIQIQSFEDLVRYGLLSAGTTETLMKNYRDVNDIDLWTGILSELDVDDAVVGYVGACIVGLQFRDLKFGDRFYFEHRDQSGSFTHQQREELRKTTLTKMICLNTEVQGLPCNAQLFVSESNPLVKCDEVKGMDLSYWKSKKN